MLIADSIFHATDIGWVLGLVFVFAVALVIVLGRMRGGPADATTAYVRGLAAIRDFIGRLTGRP